MTFEQLPPINDIKVDKTPLPSLLYKRYALNNIFIKGKKYYILNNLLQQSGMLDDIDFPN